MLPCKYKFTNGNYNFKKQTIYCSSSERKPMGVEVLVDFSRLVHHQSHFASDPDNFLAQASEALVFKLTQNISNNDWFNWSGQSIFINLERKNLCNDSLIENICILSKQLKQYQITLVVELTERNPCGMCDAIANAVGKLQAEKVNLAVDDFDLYGNDFRSREVELYQFDFIKVEMPNSPKQLKFLDRFAKQRQEHIIVERIETKEQIDRLKNCANYIWGYQGFHFDTGSQLSL